MKSRNYILLPLLLLTSFCATAQISGNNPVLAGTTHTYTYTQSALSSPSWQVSGGTKIGETFNFSNYTVTITWGAGPSGGMVLLDNFTPVANLSVTINPALSAPVATPATNVTPTSFTANWNSVSGAQNYYLDVSTSSSFSTFVSGYNNKTLASSSLSDVVTGLSASTSYYYRVRAGNVNGTSPNSNIAHGDTPPVAPVASTATAITETSFTANWAASTGATGYRLDVSTNSSFSSFVSGYNDLTVSGTSSPVNGLTSGTTYYYRVRAVSSASVFSANSSTITVPTVPSPPVASAATSITASSFTANWAPATGASSYLLYVGDTNSPFTPNVVNGSSVSTTSENIASLTANKTYYYYVRSVNASGASGGSSTISVLTLCVAPTASAATSITASSFTANWSASTGATGYRLDVSTNSSFSSFVSGYNDLSVAGTTSPVSGLSAGTTYYYRVRAVNATGASTNSSTITVLLIPAVPVFGTTTSITSSSFTLNWAAVTGAASYRLDISLNSGFSSFISGYNNLSITGTSRSVTGLLSGRTYYCRLRSVNASGTSGNSTAATVITIPAAPTASSPSAITANSFTANWAASTGAASYRLDVSTSSSFATFVSGYNNLTVAGTTANITAQPMNTNYYYRVRAVNASGTSANSGVITLDLDHNYVQKTAVLKSGYLSTGAVNNAPSSDKAITYEFYDGLGRPAQTVIKNGSPSGLDVVQAMVYDQYGREAFKYLPYADGTSGWYKENALKDPTTGVYTSGKQYQFYQTGGLLASDTKPYAETRFEPSPLNRVLEQGAPGLAWQPDPTDSYSSADNTVKSAYQVVNSGSIVRLWTYNYQSPNSEGMGLVDGSTFYPANKIYRNRTKNEDGNEILEYKDDQGRIVLRRVQAVASPTETNDNHYAGTYYIYNSMGQLACVLPPEATKRLTAEYLSATTANKELFLKRWAFRYKYDERGRMIRKQLPGAGQIIMIYDDLDRLALSQDSVQRAKTPTKEWTFTKYDVYGRPVLTGRYESNSSYSTLKSAIATHYNAIPAGQPWAETYYGSAAGAVVLGYDNKCFPSETAEAKYYTATYYDKYDTYMAPTGYAYTTQSLVDPETSIAQQTVAVTSAVRLIGQVTGMLVKNLGPNTWLRTVTYYDQKYRPVQVISDHQKGKVTASNIYDFVGKVLYTRRTYVVNSVTTYVSENPHYDQFGRLLHTKHATNGPTEVMVSKNEYNEVGQPVDKKLHSTDGGTTFKQSVDYRYNIRGWLTKINEANVATIAAGDATADYFGMEMAYQNALSGTTATAQYSGNISAIQWSKGDGGTARRQAYSFAYDNMSRLKDANHFDFERQGSVLDWYSNSNGYGENLTYDLNGNILTLLRKGFKGSSLDNLTYTYSGNQLSYVNDAADATLGFVNGNTGADDYSYDGNGNLNKDKNKGFNTAGDIKYNFLNLPEEIKKGANEKVKYLYDATGRKLVQEVYNTSGVLTKTTDYIGEMVYENNVLKLIQQPEGRVLPDGANWEYQYFIRDHLGNVRITFTTKTQTASNYTTDFEAATNANFQNYNNTTFDLVDHTDAGTAYQKVQWLNGGANGRVGLAKSLAVMPGDQVSITAYAKYMNLGTTPNTNALITSLAAAFGGVSGAPGDPGKIYNGLNSYVATVPGGDHYQDNEGAPKAFVTIIFFDKDYNLIDAAWDQVTTTGAQTSPTVKQPPHDVMSISAKAPEAGYAFVFVSNEHFNFVDMYFDDVTVSHTPSSIVSTSDYFPFGLSYNSMERTGSLEQKYLYNSKELQDEMALNWYDYGARMYMPEIGRWGVIDPLAEQARRWTPYRYAFNNPLRFIDPDGRFEYSDGYSTQESRNSTGSMSFSGSYNGTSADFGAGSSASTTVIASIKDGKGNTKQVAVPPGGMPAPAAPTGSTATPQQIAKVVLDLDGNIKNFDKGAQSIFVENESGELLPFHHSLVDKEMMTVDAFGNALTNLVDGMELPDGSLLDTQKLYNGKISVGLRSGQTSNGGVNSGLASSFSRINGLYKVTYQHLNQGQSTVKEIRKSLGIHEYYSHGVRGWVHEDPNDQVRIQNTLDNY